MPINFIGYNKSFQLVCSLCNLTTIKTIQLLQLLKSLFAALEATFQSTNLLQMLVRVHISAWIPGVYDYQCNSVLICKRFNSIKIHLPAFIRQKIKMPNVDMPKSSTKFIDGKPWSWKQDICTRASKQCHSNIDGLRAAGCDKYIIGCQLVRKITREVFSNGSVKIENIFKIL